jgi:hypothetical protein
VYKSDCLLINSKPLPRRLKNSRPRRLPLLRVSDLFEALVLYLKTKLTLATLVAAAKRAEEQAAKRAAAAEGR